MADTYGPPIGAYTTVGGVVNGTAKDSLAAQIVKFAALLGITFTGGNGVAGAYALIEAQDSPHPDFDAIRVEIRDKIGAELAALWDAVDAAAEV